MKYRNKLIGTIICILAMILSVGNLVVLATEEDCQLIIDYQYKDNPVGGAVFNVHCVGEINDKGSITLTGNFEDYPVYIETDYTETDKLTALAQTLYGFVIRDSVEPEYSVVTDDDGGAVINEMKSGVYLVSGEKCVDGENTYVTEPYIVFLPHKENNGNLSNSLEIKPKCFKLGIGEPVSVKVLKAWEDNGNETKRPISIEVVLFKDSEKYESATLSAENNWRCTWENLSSSNVWTVVEEVPHDYIVIQTQEGVTRLITNYYSDPPYEDNTVPSETTTSDNTNPPTTPMDGNIPSGGTSSNSINTPTGNSRLPQTGMLWWPVPLLILIGIILVVWGLVKRRGEDFEA